MPSWRLVAAGAALAVYALLSHLLMVHVPGRPWAVAALFGPLLLAVGASGWQRRHGPTLLGCVALLVLLALLVERGGVTDMHRMYVLQHAGVHLALAWAFGSTLRRGETPLISALGERVHPYLTPAMRAYMRRLTALWMAYFLAMVLLSGSIYALAPWSAWSLFGNLITPLTALALFVGEHGWRRWRHPDFERASLVQAWQAWRRSPGPAR